MKKILFVLLLASATASYFLLRPKSQAPFDAVDTRAGESTESVRYSDLDRTLDKISKDLRELDKDIQFEIDLDIYENL